MRLNAMMAFAIIVGLGIIAITSLGFFIFTFTQVVKAKGEPINFYQDKLNHKKYKRLVPGCCNQRM